MKRRDIPVYAVLHFLYIVVASVAARLFSNIVVRIADLFVELDFFSASIIRLITLFVFSFALIIFLSYKNGYREARFDKVESVASASVAALVHWLFGVLLGFIPKLGLSYTPWLFGATRHIAGFLAFGVNYNDSGRVEDIPLGLLALVGFLTACLIVLAATLANYKGFRARLAHRAELTRTNE